MTSKRKEPMELPLLEVVYLPGDPVPLGIVMPGDWEVSGEIHISMGATKQQLIEVLKLLHFVNNHVADTLINMYEPKEPPFKPTGKVTSEGDHTE